MYSPVVEQTAGKIDHYRRTALDGLCRLGLDGVNFALRFAGCRPTHAIERVLLAKLRSG